jgi:Uma2 family endonuclease
MNPVLPSQTEQPLTAQEQRMEELLDRIWDLSKEPDVEALEELTDLLPSEDGIPMETPWHRGGMNLLIDVVTYHERENNDFYVGGNMFVYYFKRPKRRPQFKGPDFFYVKGVERHLPRDKWACWFEGKFPDVIIELLSPSTAENDRTVKKDVYEQDFHTPEYFLYDPSQHTIEGWRLNAHNKYQPITPNERGWLWSEKLELWLGTWKGEYVGLEATWPRFYDANGRLVPRESEGEAARAEVEKQRAEIEKQRADTAEAENARLRERLAALERERPNG